MSFIFKQATRDAAKLLLGLAGPSGSGKTLSSLRLATGLGGPIAYIDTEQGRATQYAGEFEFMHAVLPPPFSPDRYRSIIDDAIAIKPNVIIVDSASHEWESEGGILEMVDAIKERNSSRGNDFSAWAGPKQAHQKLVNRLLQVPAHVILAMRAKEKRGLAPDRNKPGKMEVVNLGWHPVAESGLTYELTISVLLSSDRKGVPIVDGYDFGKLPFNMANLFPTNEQISEDTGRRLAAWAKGEAPAQPAKPHLDLLNAAGAVEAVYESVDGWLAGIGVVSRVEGVVKANAPLLDRIVKSQKATEEQRARAQEMLSLAA